MKRKELLQKYGIKGSFLNMLLNRSKVMERFKVGTGYASDYDEKTIFLILFGWELHRLGIAFRYIEFILRQLEFIRSNMSNKLSNCPKDLLKFDAPIYIYPLIGSCLDSPMYSKDAPIDRDFIKVHIKL